MLREQWRCGDCGRTIFGAEDEDIEEHLKECEKRHSPVNSPKHYTSHPSGVECIQITEHMNFCLGNAIKYIWRASLKGGREDLEKARWYIDRELKKFDAP